MKKSSFAAQTRASDRKPVGRQWAFEVTAQQSKTGKKEVKLVKQVIFWIGVGLVVVGIVTWKVMLGMEAGAEDAG